MTVDKTTQASETPTPKGSRSDASVVTQFFLLPLAVVAGLAGVFLLFTMATRKEPTPEEYLKTLREGRFNQRWQAAFELSNLMKKPSSTPNAPFAGELVRLYRASSSNPDEDPRVIRYLALALGHSGSPEAVAPLLEATGSKDGETRLYALWGLAQLHAAEAEGGFLKGLSDPDPAIRSLCAYGLGLIPGSSSMTEVKRLLSDTVPEVQWNAALSLARKGDPSGEIILIRILDRKYLEEFPEMDSADKSELILNALRGLKSLKTNGLDDKVRSLAESDPDPTVRRAAASWNEVEGG